MMTAKTRFHFSRKLLAIPYAIFLALFVVAPLIIIIYYAFTNGDTGKFTFENFKNYRRKGTENELNGHSFPGDVGNRFALCRPRHFEEQEKSLDLCNRKSGGGGHIHRAWL